MRSHLSTIACHRLPLNVSVRFKLRNTIRLRCGLDMSVMTEEVVDFPSYNATKEPPH